MSEQTKRCVHCCAELPQAAQVCSSCRLHQGWRRHISFGNTALSLLVALIAVSAALLQVVRETYVDITTARDPVVVSTGLIGQLDGLFLFATFFNRSGSKVLLNPSFQCEVRNGDAARSFFMTEGAAPHDATDFKTIAPQDFVRLTLHSFTYDEPLDLMDLRGINETATCKMLIVGPKGELRKSFSVLFDDAYG